MIVKVVEQATWTPQQDLGDSSSDGAGGGAGDGGNSREPAAFSLSLPREDRVRDSGNRAREVRDSSEMNTS